MGGNLMQDPMTTSDRDLVATVDWQQRVVYVVFAYRDQVAKRWHVAKPADQAWSIAGPEGRQVSLFVAEVTEGRVPLVPVSIGTLRVVKGRKCMGNRPPGSDDIGCESVGTLSMSRKQTVGYSFCESSEDPNDLCEESFVQVGDQVFYRDKACTDKAGGAAYYQWVCIP